LKDSLNLQTGDPFPVPRSPFPIPHIPVPYSPYTRSLFPIYPFPIPHILLLILALVSCSRTRPAAETEGRRIVSTAPAITEIIAGLGLAQEIIACDRYSTGVEGTPPEALIIDFFYPDGEALLALDAGIIITGEINRALTGSDPFHLLEEAGTRVLYLPTSTTIEGISGDILLIAEALGVPERGEALAKSLGADISALADGTASGVTRRPRVYFEVAPWPGMVSFGRGTYLHGMIELAGGGNIFADHSGWFSPAGEAILMANPDIIFVLSDSPDQTGEAMRQRPGFAGIRAVEEDQVFPIDADSASRPSQHIVKALGQMAQAIDGKREMGNGK